MPNEHLVEVGEAIAAPAADMHTVAVELAGLVGIAAHEMSPERLRPMQDLLRYHWSQIQPYVPERFAAGLEVLEYPETVNAAIQLDGLLDLLAGQMHMIVPGSFSDLTVVLTIQDYAQRVLYAANDLRAKAILEQSVHQESPPAG
jgi:hypothetical protein